MICSRSSEYAIRATIHLAQVPQGKSAMVKDIATREGIPSQFLAKILQQLAQKGILQSMKGPTGGFCLKQPAHSLTLIDIIFAVDGLNNYDQCLCGRRQCSDGALCPLYDDWKRLRERITSYLRRTTILNLANKVRKRSVRAASSAVGTRSLLLEQSRQGCSGPQKRSRTR